jgi:hypothetical protein
MTWENIVLQPTDPILANKMQPRVAERRARFRTMVKGALGVCVAFCLVATAATALSSNATGTSASSSIGKAAPATAIVPVEKLDLGPSRTRATNRVTAAARPAPAPKFGKRH